MATWSFYWGPQIKNILLSEAVICFSREESSNCMLMKEGVVMAEINNWLAKFLELMGQESLWSHPLACSDFQLTSPDFVKVFGGFFVARADSNYLVSQCPASC